MKHADIKRFIKIKGYCTLSELKSEFTENTEILEMNLTYLTEKDRVRQVAFKKPNGTDNLYYILPE